MAGKDEGGKRGAEGGAGTIRQGEPTRTRPPGEDGGRSPKTETRDESGGTDDLLDQQGDSPPLRDAPKDRRA